MTEKQPLVSLSATGMHILSEEVAEKLEKKKLSPSLVTGLEGCHVRWGFQTFVQKEILPESPDNAASRGSMFHKVMELFFARDPQDRNNQTLKEDVANTLMSDEFAIMRQYPEAMKWLKNSINSFLSMGSDPSRIKVATIKNDWGKEVPGLEVFVKGKIGNTSREILGFIDRVSELPDGRLAVEDWKGLALDTLLPTPQGWTTMGSVQVDDEILGTNGKPVKVIAKSGIHHRPCYKITFRDGSEIVCDNVHLWTIDLSVSKKNHHTGKKNLTVSADELYELWNKGDRDYIQIRNPKPIEFSEKKLPIDPYVLGVWLGDGDNRSSRITVGKQEIGYVSSALESRWDGEVAIHQEGTTYFVTLKKLGEQKALTTILRANELLHNKHIPMEYLRASIGQRLELLRGLMDTDGYWHPKRNRAIFTSTDKALIEGVSELIVSLGMTPSIFRVENEYKGYWDVCFTPSELNPFHLPRKRDLVEKLFSKEGYRFYKGKRRYIKTIEKIPSVPTQCIKVDSENSLFLCGPLYTPTHNTGGTVKRWNPDTKSTDGLGEARQQVIYSMLLEQRGYNVAGARLIYPCAKDKTTGEPAPQVININTHDEKFIQRITDDIEQADKKLDDIIAQNNFEFAPDFLCAWCPLAKACPKATIKPYAKMQEAFATQPDPEVLSEGVLFQ